MEFKESVVSEDLSGIEEVFALETEEISFLGALVKEEGRRSSVQGRIRFQTGQRCFFHHRSANRDDLRKKLRSLSEGIASIPC